MKLQLFGYTIIKASKVRDLEDQLYGEMLENCHNDAYRLSMQLLLLEFSESIKIMQLSHAKLMSSLTPQDRRMINSNMASMYDALVKLLAIGLSNGKEAEESQTDPIPEGIKAADDWTTDRQADSDSKGS